MQAIILSRCSHLTWKWKLVGAGILPFYHSPPACTNRVLGCLAWLHRYCRSTGRGHPQDHPSHIRQPRLGGFHSLTQFRLGNPSLCSLSKESITRGCLHHHFAQAIPEQGILISLAIRPIRKRRSSKQHWSLSLAIAAQPCIR